MKKFSLHNLNTESKISLFAIVVLSFGVVLAVQQSMQQQQTRSNAAGELPVGQSGGWTMVVSDEFNGTSLDTTKWIPCIGNGKVVGTKQCQGWGSELQTYKPENVTVTNGSLHLIAQKQNNTYTSGAISTAKDIFGFNQPNYKDFTYRYGYLETRVKIPGGQGIWPAVWQLPYNGNGAEIDLVEILGSDVSKAYLTLHKDGGAQEQGIVSGVNFASSYHVFGVEWRADKILWYVDGVKRFETTGTGIPNQPMYLMANLAVGGDWPGPPNSSTIFPAMMDVDYIRVWQKISASPTPTRIPSPTISAGATKVTVSLKLHGLGNGGDSANQTGAGNFNLLHPQRTVTVEVFNAQNQLVLTKQGTVIFNATTGKFAGNIDMGNLASGAYTMKIKTNQFLKVTFTGIQNVIASQTKQLPEATLLTGDVNGDNQLNILDYNVLMGCYADFMPAKNCTTQNKALADLTDEGPVNQLDYNLLLREFGSRAGN